MASSPPLFPGQHTSIARSTLMHFTLDITLALATLLVLSFLGSAVWQVLPDGLAQLVITVGSLGLTALLLYLLRRPKMPHIETPPRTGTWGIRTLMLAIATGAGMMLASSALFVLLEAVGVEAAPSNVAVIEPLLRSHPMLLLVCVVLLAPLYEEVLFRRILFGRWWAAGRPGIGIALSAALFALSHEIPGLGGNPWALTGVLWLVYAAMGSLLAGLYRRTGELWPAIVAHGVNNLCAVLVLFLQNE